MQEALLKEIRDLLAEIKELLKGYKPVSDGRQVSASKINSEQESASWEQHLTKKDPQNDYEIIALVVEWLTRGEKRSVTKEEIEEFIREHPDRMSNLEPNKIRGVIDNTKSHSSYKYIDFVDKKNDKTYRLSAKGKKITNELPDRPQSKSKKKSSRKK